LLCTGVGPWLFIIMCCYGSLRYLFDLLLLPSSLLLYVALVPACPCGLDPSIWYYPPPLLLCKWGKGNMKLKLQAQFFKGEFKKISFVFLVCFSLCLYVVCEYVCVLIFFIAYVLYVNNFRLFVCKVYYSHFTIMLGIILLMMGKMLMR